MAPPKGVILENVGFILGLFLKPNHAKMNDKIHRLWREWTLLGFGVFRNVFLVLIFDAL